MWPFCIRLPFADKPRPCLQVKSLKRNYTHFQNLYAILIVFSSPKILLNIDISLSNPKTNLERCTQGNVLSLWPHFLFPDWEHYNRTELISGFERSLCSQLLIKLSLAMEITYGNSSFRWYSPLNSGFFCIYCAWIKILNTSWHRTAKRSSKSWEVARAIVWDLRETDLLVISFWLQYTQSHTHARRHTHTRMELVQTGSELTDPGWRAAHYLHGPGWAWRILMLKICGLCLMPVEPA